MPGDDKRPAVRLTLGGEVENVSGVYGPDEIHEWYPAPDADAEPRPDRTPLSPLPVDDGGRPVVRRTAEGTVRPSFSVFLLLAGDFHTSSPYDSELDLQQIVQSGSTWVSLRSAGSDHRAHVRVELWSGRPEADGNWEFSQQTTVTPEWDEVEVTDFEITERDAVVVPVDRGVPLVVRVQVRGRSHVAVAEVGFSRWLAEQDESTLDYANLPIPAGIEQWLIQLWPDRA